MKLAVIFAIIQMSLGIFMKGMNSLHFRNRLDFFFEFIPQFLLLFALFGWMDILIIAKWLSKKNVENITLSYCPPEGDPNREALFKQYNEVHLSPAIISTMIDIFLNGADNSYKSDTKPCGLETIEYNYVVEGQKALSIIFLLVALACVPVMLMVKPLILKRQLAHHDHGQGEGV